LNPSFCRFHASGGAYIIYKSTPTMNIIIVDRVHKTVEEPMHGQQNTYIHG